MIRPKVVYLTTPIEIEKIKIGHTYDGLKYLIEHYTKCMEVSTGQQMNAEARQQCSLTIENLKQRVELCDKHKIKPNESNSNIDSHEV